MKTYMVKGTFLENSPKKRNRHILRRKKTGFEIAKICGGFGQNHSFLLLKWPYIYIYT
jgi:hypothetical protein